MRTVAGTLSRQRKGDPWRVVIDAGLPGCRAGQRVLVTVLDAGEKVGMTASEQLVLYERARESGLGLTGAELETLTLMQHGASAAELARREGVTGSAIRTRLNRAYAKLGAKHLTQAIVRARELGLLDPLPGPGVGA